MAEENENWKLHQHDMGRPTLHDSDNYRWFEPIGVYFIVTSNSISTPRQIRLSGPSKPPPAHPSPYPCNQCVSDRHTRALSHGHFGCLILQRNRKALLVGDSFQCSRSSLGNKGLKPLQETD